MKEDAFGECPKCKCLHFLEYKCEVGDDEILLKDPYYDFSNRGKENWN